VGASGSSASLTLGNIVVNTLSAGSNATLSIVNSGTSLNNVWYMTFGLPETLSSSSSALVSVTNSGTINDAIFNMKFQIPQGIQGIQGVQGVNGVSSTITLGTITTETLSSSSSALVTVTNSGTTNDAIFNMKF
jgi:hypothetical protein